MEKLKPCLLLLLQKILEKRRREKGLQIQKKMVTLVTPERVGDRTCGLNA